MVFLPSCFFFSSHRWHVLPPKIYSHSKPFDMVGPATHIADGTREYDPQQAKTTTKQRGLLSSLFFPTIHPYSLWVTPKRLRFHIPSLVFILLLRNLHSSQISDSGLCCFPQFLLISVWVSGYTWVWSSLCELWSGCLVLASGSVWVWILDFDSVKWGGSNGDVWFQYQSGDHGDWIWYECDFYCVCVLENNLWEIARVRWISEYVWIWTKDGYRTGNFSSAICFWKWLVLSLCLVFMKICLFIVYGFDSWIIFLIP